MAQIELFEKRKLHFFKLTIEGGVPKTLKVEFLLRSKIFQNKNCRDCVIWWYLSNKLWSHWKILIFDHVMGQNGPQNVRMLMYGHIFYGYNSAIFNNRAEIYYVNCQILSVKWRWEIVILIHFKKIFLKINGRGRHPGVKGVEATKPDLDVDSLDGPFVSNFNLKITNNSVTFCFFTYKKPLPRAF